MSITKILKKIIPAALIIMLAVVMLVDMPVKAAEAGTAKYISDVAIETGSDANDCKNKLRAAGYTVYDANLNEGNEGDYEWEWYYNGEQHFKTMHVGKTYSYIGYKVTTDKSQAITKISAMNMNGGFVYMTYRDMIKSMADGLLESVALLRRSLAGFKKNVDAKSPAALLALESLNIFVVPEMNNMPLGDYLLDTSRTDDELTDILMIANSRILSLIYNQIAFGVADDMSVEGATTIWQRWCDVGPLDFTDMDEDEIEEYYENELDDLYYERISPMLKVMQDYVTQYNDSLTRFPDGVYHTDEEDTKEYTAEERYEMIKDAQEESLDTDEESSSGGADPYILGLYNTLNAKNDDGTYVYPYGTDEDGNPQSLAQFIIKVGSTDSNDGDAVTDAVRSLYTLVMPREGKETPCDDALAATFQIVGMTTMSIAESDDAEYVGKTKEIINIAIEKYKESSNGASPSVWLGVNKSVYDERIALTSAEYRASAAKDSFSSLTSMEIEQEKEGMNYKDMLLLAGIVGGAALVMAGVAILCAVVIPAICCAVGGAALLGFSTAAIVGSVFATIGTVVLPVLIAVVVVAVVVILVIALVKYIKFKKAEKKVVDTTVLDPIAPVMYDYGDDKQAIRYDVIKNTSGNAADVNNGMSFQWVSLYYTKDTRAGSPIIEDNGAAFGVNYSMNLPQSNWTAVTYFGDVLAGDLNRGAKPNDVGRVFLYYHSEDYTVANSEIKKYVSNVRLFSNSDEETAREALRDSGCYAIDINLTPGTGMYTFLGFEMTDSANRAITDLRFSYATGLDPKGAQQRFGTASYGSCGSVGNLILWETMSTEAGTPILTSGFHIISDLSQKQDGWEGVNLFSGGVAYDMCLTGNGTFDGKGGGYNIRYLSSLMKLGTNYHTYIFFTPETQYKSTDAGATAYLGGLTFASGVNDTYIDTLATSNGFTKLTTSDSGVTLNLDHPKSSLTGTYLYYSTTYNPYRAIYNIASYEYEPNAQAANYSFGDGTATYCAVDVMQNYNEYVSGSEYTSNYCTTLRFTHAYITNSRFEKGSYFPTYSTSASLLSAFGSSTWSNMYASVETRNGQTYISSLKIKALYVTGKYTGGEPILANALVVSSNPQLTNMTPVRSITDWYSSSADNLCYHDDYRKGVFYLYINREETARPKYIASVSIVYSNAVTQYDSEGKVSTYTQNYTTNVMTANAKGHGTLITTNLTGQTWWYNSATTGGNLQNHIDDGAIAFIWITYTDVAQNAISDLFWRETSSAEKEYTYVNDAGAYFSLQGDGFYYNGKYYFLYSTKGVAKMTDIRLDDEIMSNGYLTCVDCDGTASSYDYKFLKVKKETKDKQEYFNGFYVGLGATENLAKIDLLNNGCRSCIPFNITPDSKQAAFLGMITTTVKKKAMAAIILHDCAQDSSIRTVSYKRYKYTKNTDNINGVYDAQMCVFVTRDSKLSAKADTTRCDTRIIDGVAFFWGTDLNEYCNGTKTLAATSDQNLNEYLNGLMEEYTYYDANGNEVTEARKWDLVTNEASKLVNINIGGLVYNGSARSVYMYVHYTDNYARDPATLTASVFSDCSFWVIATMAAVIVGGGIGTTIIVKRKKNKKVAISEE